MREPRSPDTIFWVEPSAIQAEHLTLDAEESHHLLHVHRAAMGAAFVAVDGLGGTYECVLDSAERGVAVGKIVRRELDAGEPPVPITLLVGLPDAGPAEAVVLHAVPLGATTIDFVAMARSGRPAFGSARLERLARIARSALKQSRRSRMPVLRSSPNLKSAIELSGEGRRYFADPAGERLRNRQEGGSETAVILAIGPPGGFDDAELELVRRHNFVSISLVGNRLTTETAAISVLALARNLLM